MSNRIFKDGCRVEFIEIEVRAIDQHGDAFDVTHFEGETALRDAKLFALELVLSPDIAAAVIERHTSRHPAHLFPEPDKYETLATFGDGVALKAGGWIE